MLFVGKFYILLISHQFHFNGTLETCMDTMGWFEEELTNVDLRVDLAQC